MSKQRSATEIWATLESIGHIWELNPELRLGQLIDRIARNPTELAVIKDRELLKRLGEEYL